MAEFDAIELGRGVEGSVSLPLRFMTRHGLITGATGSGKTVSLQLLAEQLSRAGVPVFLPDVKGDLIGIANAGQLSDKVSESLRGKGLQVPDWQACPTRLWSVGGAANSSALSARVQTVGPLLLARLLDLNDIQASVMQIAFRIAREQKRPLDTLADLRALFGWLADNRETLAANYGAFAETTLSTIQRGLVVLEEQQAGHFFTTSELSLADLIQCEGTAGVVNLLDARSLLLQPSLYAVAFSSLLARLYEELPEVGDLPQPKLVIFIDEAHLLFEALGKSVQENLERAIRLIRSRGVGVFFVSQLPTDIPEKVLGQLGNRVQHVLRSFTPKDQKAVKVAAQTMRPNQGLDIESAIGLLAPGEALVSILDGSGTPTPTQKIWINMPGSQIGASGAVNLLQPITGQTAAARDPVDSSNAPVAYSGDTKNEFDWRTNAIRGMAITAAWLLRAGRT